MKYPEYIENIISRLEAAGEEAYIVGGSLRDSLLCIPAHDFDIATSALPEKTCSIFSDMRVIETGIKHGTVTVIAEGQPVEITTFRIDGSYTDSRHPDAVTFTSRIEEDLSRRDFTVNAMAFSPTRGTVDPFGGKEDLEKRIIRAVREPRLRFSEDALRIMRAFRFSAQLGFSIDEDTLEGAQKTREGLSCIARERISSEFIKLLTSPSPKEAIRLMEKCGVLCYVCKEYSPSEGILDALEKMPRVDIARMGVFFSDASQDEIRDILHSLKCSNKQITGTLAVARGARVCVDSPRAATALIAKVGDYAPLAVKASLLLGVSPPVAESYVERNRAPSKISELCVNGRDLLEIGFSGKDIGRVLGLLLEVAMESPEKNERRALLEIAQGLWKEENT